MLRTDLIDNNIVIYEGSEIAKIFDGHLLTKVIDNKNSPCQSLYVIPLTPKKRRFNFNSGPQPLKIMMPYEPPLCVTSQTLFLFNGTLHRKETNWLHNRVLYQLMYKASIDLQEQGENLLPELCGIKQGYLGMLLRLKRQFPEATIEALYGLHNVWQYLSYLDDMFVHAPLIIHVKLVNLGLLNYFNANSGMLHALSQGKWTTLRSILNYYANSPLIDFTIADKFLRKRPDIAYNLPQDLLLKLFDLVGSRRVPLKSLNLKALKI
jgi:hypothetical protein